MKNVVIFALFVLFCFSCKQSRNIALTTRDNNSFQIKSIKKGQSAYLIEAYRNDSVFKIISEKYKNSDSNCSKIKKGEYYNLKLEQIFPIKDANGSYYSMVKEFEHKGITIKINKKFHSTVYSAINLSGICILDK